MIKFISVGQVCKLLGISCFKAYRCLKIGKLKESFRTVGHHRWFDLLDIKSHFIGNIEQPDFTIAYARVSSHDQKEDLVMQQAKLLAYATLNAFLSFNKL